jgi:4-oxalocrotonate tautomerase
VPFINVKLLEGVFTEGQKRDIVKKMTDTMVDVAGEALRPAISVVVEEVKSGYWGVGGEVVTTEDAVRNNTKRGTEQMTSSRAGTGL